MKIDIENYKKIEIYLYVCIDDFYRANKNNIYSGKFLKIWNTNLLNVFRMF